LATHILSRLYVCTLLTMAAALWATSGSTCSAQPPPEPAGTLTVNTAEKTSKADHADVNVFRLLNRSGSIHLVVMNNRATHQIISVRFAELAEPKYDVYLNCSRRGQLTMQQLSGGMQIDIPPAPLAADRVVIQRIASGSDSAIASLKGSPQPDAAFITAVMSNVRSWSEPADGRLRNAGATYILLTPSDRAVDSTVWVPQSANDAIVATSKYWTAINYERSTLHTRVKNIDLRNRALSAITPLDFKAQLRGGTTPLINCSLVNQCETTLSGKLILEGVRGLKPPVPVRFKSLGPGKSFQAAFNLKGLPADLKPEALKVRAEITVGPVAFVKTVPVTTE
jgi:hypothetical protein